MNHTLVVLDCELDQALIPMGPQLKVRLDWDGHLNCKETPRHFKNLLQTCQIGSILRASLYHGAPGDLQTCDDTDRLFQGYIRA